MATNVSQRRLWIQTKRLDLAEDNEDDIPIVLKDLHIRQEMDSDLVQHTIKHSLGIPDDLILKLRNHRGSLIPINSKLMANSKTVPYMLEVVRAHQHVAPRDRTIEMPGYNESMRTTLAGFEQRIDHLEAAVPELHSRQDSKLKSEMEDVEHKLAFLNKRFEQADSIKWTGMFKKHPMW